MEINLFKQYLKLSTDELSMRGKINSLMKEEIYTNIDLINYKDWIDVSYNDFDKLTSIGAVFNDSDREVTVLDQTPLPNLATVKTYTLSLGTKPRTIKGIIIKASIPENVNIMITYNNILKYNLKKFDTNEVVNTSFNLEFSFDDLTNNFYKEKNIFE